MISLDEEPEAAEAAEVALDNLSPNVGATIRKTKDVAAHAVTSSPTDRFVNDARFLVVATLSNLLDTPEDAREDALLDRVEEAKAAIEEWINCLEID